MHTISIYARTVNAVAGAYILCMYVYRPRTKIINGRQRFFFLLRNNVGVLYL